MRWRMVSTVLVALCMSLLIVTPAQSSARFDPHAYYSGVRIDKYDVTINMSKSLGGYVRLDVVEDVTLQWAPNADRLYAFRWTGRDDWWKRYALFNNHVEVVSGDSSIKWPWSFCLRHSCSGSDTAYVMPPPLASDRHVQIRSSYTIVGDLTALASRRADVVEWSPFDMQGERTLIVTIRWNIAPELRSAVLEPSCETGGIYCRIAQDNSVYIQREVLAWFPILNNEPVSWIYVKPDTFTLGVAFWSGNDWFIAAIPLFLICIALMAWRYFSRRVREEILPNAEVHPSSQIISEYSPGEVAALLLKNRELGVTVLFDLAIRGCARFIEVGKGQFDILFHPSKLADDSMDREVVDMLIATYPKNPPRYSLDSVKSEVLSNGITRVANYLDRLNVARDLTGNMWVRHGFAWGNTAIAAAAVICVSLGLGLRDTFTYVPALFYVAFMVLTVARERGSVATKRGLDVIDRAADLRAYFDAVSLDPRHHRGIKRIKSYSEWEKMLPWAIALGKSRNWIEQLSFVDLPKSWPSWITTSHTLSAESLAEKIDGIVKLASTNSGDLQVKRMSPPWVKFFEDGPLTNPSSPSPGR